MSFRPDLKPDASGESWTPTARLHLAKDVILPPHAIREAELWFHAGGLSPHHRTMSCLCRGLPWFNRQRRELDAGMHTHVLRQVKADGIMRYHFHLRNDGDTPLRLRGGRVIGRVTLLPDADTARVDVRAVHQYPTEDNAMQVDGDNSADAWWADMPDAPTPSCASL